MLVEIGQAASRESPEKPLDHFAGVEGYFYRAPPKKCPKWSEFDI
jgi:hypothetical protein